MADGQRVIAGADFALVPTGGLRTDAAPGRVTALTLPDGRPVEAGERYSVAVNGFLAAGGGDFEVFEESENPRAVGTDAGESPQPFFAPDPNRNPRVTISR